MTLLKLAILKVIAPDGKPIGATARVAVLVETPRPETWVVISLLIAVGPLMNNVNAFCCNVKNDSLSRLKSSTTLKSTSVENLLTTPSLRTFAPRSNSFMFKILEDLEIDSLETKESVDGS